MKAIRDKSWREKEANKRMGLTARQILVVVAAYILSEYNMEITQKIALNFYKKKAKLGQSPEPVFPVRDWFIDAPKDFDPYGINRSKYDIKVCEDAVRFIAEVKSVFWIREQNFTREVAPSSRALIYYFKSEVTKLDQPDLANAVVNSLEMHNNSLRRTARRWVRKFRDRWHVNRGCLPCLDAPPSSQLLGRAASMQVEMCCICLVIFCPAFLAIKYLCHHFSELVHANRRCPLV